MAATGGNTSVVKQGSALRTKFPRTDFFKLVTQKGNDLLLPKRRKKLGVTAFVWRAHAPQNTLNLKNRASLADKTTVSVSPKILQLDL